MYKMITLMALVSTMIGVAQEVKHSVYFGNDKHLISQDESEKLIEFIQSIEETCSDYEIKLEGHTDYNASNDYNMNLSSRRADQVKQFLAGNDVQNIVYAGYFGEEKPIGDNSTSKGRAANRRVDIVFQCNSDNNEDDGDEENSRLESTTSIDDLYALLSSGYQTFNIDPTIDNTIRGEQGTILLIPANSFKVSRSCRNINIELKEVYNKSDMILENLSTSSNGKLIESGGTIDVRATYKNRAVKLRQPVGIMMPSREYKSGMELFYGDHDPHQDVNWLQNGQQAGYYNGNLGMYWGDNCHFFFCKIKRFFTRVFGSKAKREAIKADKQTMKELEEKYENMSASAVTNAMDPEMNYYMFGSTELNLINCDRFLNLPPERLVAYKVDLQPTKTTDAKIVYRSINSIFPGNRAEDNFVYVNAPKKKRIWVVAFKYENGKAEMALEETTIKELPFTDLNFKEYTIKEMREKLKILNT